MTGYTNRHQLPYPEAGDPVYLGAKAIEDLAKKIDPVLGTGSGGGDGGGDGGASDEDLDAIRRDIASLSDRLTTTTRALDTVRAEAYGGSDRTRAPLAEIGVTSNIAVPATTDRLAQASWAPLVDTDGGVVISGTYGVTRYNVPVSGRYIITYQLLHSADNARAGAALKILVNGQNVLTNSIASETAAASLEGPTMSVTTERTLSAGDQVRWGYWYSAATTILPNGFGTARSKITIRYVGPR